MKTNISNKSIPNMKQIFNISNYSLSALIVLLSITGCDSVSTRTMSVPITTVSGKKPFDKDKAIAVVKEIVTTIAIRHGFVEDDLAQWKVFDSDNTKYLFHHVRIVKRAIGREVKDNISISLEDNKLIRIKVYRMNSINPPSDLDPVFADFLFECANKLELYPITFEHDSNNIILGMGFIEHGIDN